MKPRWSFEYEFTEAAPELAAGREVREGAAPVLELRIEELVLTGFTPADRFRFGDAVERELARLLGERGWAGLRRNSISADRLDGGKFKVAQGARAQAIGGQIAEAVYRQVSSLGKQVSASRTAKVNSRGRR